MRFSRSEPEYRLPSGKRADIVVFDSSNRPWLVIEAKRNVAGENYTRNFDPYSPKVVRQAYDYANQIGAPFFATYNGDMLVLFQTYEEFKPLLERKSKSYRVKDLSLFAAELLKDVTSLKSGKEKWDELDDAFVSRAKHFHDRVTPPYLIALRKELKQNSRFSAAYSRWAEEQGFDMEHNSKEVEVNLARQASYILMNQLLFYKMLSDTAAYKSEITPLLPVDNPSLLPAVLKKSFARVTSRVDFKAVFEYDPIFNNIPLTDEICSEVNDFVEELRSYDLSVFRSDVIGRIYEHLIPKDERHDLGQYYTPPAIVELITRLTVAKPTDKVLDPACGSGGFLIGAYKELKRASTGSRTPIHRKILGQLYGIDINRFPAHLSAINLAVQDISSKTDVVQIEVADFFDILPGQGRFARRVANLTGEPILETVPIPTKVDVVVANPPYIRHEMITQRERIQSLLRELGVEMSERSDIYAYFFVHASQFVEDGGRVGFITSERWLDTDYGVDLEKFFLANFRIKYIVKFDRQVFDEPLVGTCVTILEKESQQDARDSNLVKLIRVKRNMEIAELKGLLERASDKPESVEYFQAYTLATKVQANLGGDPRWARLLYAPPIYYDLVSHPRMTKVGQLASVGRGLKSGADDFFYLDKDELADHGLGPKHMVPALKHIAQVDHPKLQASDTEWRVLDVHPTLEKLGVFNSESISGRSSLEFAKKALKKAGHDDLLNYIEDGEERGLHKRPSCRRTNGIWFDLGDLPRPPIVLPQVYWKDAIIPFNADRVVVNQRLITLDPKEGVDSMLLAAILNSSMSALFINLHGRVAMGEALNRIEITVDDAKDLPIPNPEELTPTQVREIKETFKEMLAKTGEISPAELHGFRKRIDSVLLTALDFEDRQNELGEAFEELIDARVTGGGSSREVLVSGERQPRRIVRLRGAEVVTKSNLDQYV